MFNIKDVPLPSYSRREDIANSISHAVGVPFCVVAGIIMLKAQIGYARPIEIVATLIYILSTLLVFAGSAIYHGLRPSFAKKIARLIDHSNIYVMISGVVTALILTHTYEVNPKFSLKMIIAVWTLSVIGIVLTFMDLKKFNIPQIFMYVGLGWAAIFGLKDLFAAGEAGKKFLVMLLIGGACITVGTVLYLIGKKYKYFHAVFHVCVLAGTIVIFIGNYNLTISALAH